MMNNAKLYYPNMQHFTLDVNGQAVLCDGEGYLLDLDAWSEAYVQVAAKREGLQLTEEHWQVIYFIREFHTEHGVQAPVRDMVKHFSKLWGKDRGSSTYLHKNLSNRRPAETG